LNLSEIPDCNFNSPIINSLLEDSDSTIIVGTALGINILNTEKLTTSETPIFSFANITTPSDVHLLKASDGSIYHKLTTPTDEFVSVKVMDMSGKLILEMNNLRPSDDIRITDLNNAGMYMVEIRQGDFKKTIKITKVH
jgi:hypothetical protein